MVCELKFGMNRLRMKFKGKVCRRSTANPPKQPELAGEREIHKFNPQRVQRIKKETEWERVYCGTLNLWVTDDEVFDNLANMHPLFFERPESVKHPTNQMIPMNR